MDLPHTSHVKLRELLKFSEPQCHVCKQGYQKFFHYRFVVSIKGGNICKTVSAFTVMLFKGCCYFYHYFFLCSQVAREHKCPPLWIQWSSFKNANDSTVIDMAEPCLNPGPCCRFQVIATLRKKVSPKLLSGDQDSLQAQHHFGGLDVLRGTSDFEL